MQTFAYLLSSNLMRQLFLHTLLLAKSEDAVLLFLILATDQPPVDVNIFSNMYIFVVCPKEKVNWIATQSYPFWIRPES